MAAAADCCKQVVNRMHSLTLAPEDTTAPPAKRSKLSDMSDCYEVFQATCAARATRGDPVAIEILDATRKRTPRFIDDDDEIDEDAEESAFVKHVAKRRKAATKQAPRGVWIRVTMMSFNPFDTLIIMIPAESVSDEDVAFLKKRRWKYTSPREDDDEDATGIFGKIKVLTDAFRTRHITHWDLPLHAKLGPSDTKQCIVFLSAGATHPPEFCDSCSFLFTGIYRTTP